MPFMAATLGGKLGSGLLVAGFDFAFVAAGFFEAGALGAGFFAAAFVVFLTGFFLVMIILLNLFFWE
jgi:hypothetical protein